ncbi:mannonate dehydratase [Gramella sp. BOM4]|nr:mannonate dehydratase [Christiangramia bathymodioli]
MNLRIIAIIFVFIFQIQKITSQSSIPHLKKVGDETQLIVDGNPFIVLGGELGNSTFTSVDYMEPHWETLKAMNLNTVLAPVYWELIEPQEGQYDFELLDKLIEETRRNDLKMIVLWFGSWKNSMSSHVPSWVKQNQEKYPRAKDERGVSQEILTPFSKENLNADLNAFRALIQHIKEIDKGHQTVIMVQPENEIGMLPSARDYHPLATKHFKEEVPEELINYLIEHKENLVPEFLKVWKENGFRTTGNWEEIFGAGYATDEIFMAWYFSKYAEAITKAGKEIYPLPMFVNAALIRPGKIPGEYPSAGPLPHLMDIWKAGAPSIDMFSPDFYTPDFEYWNDLYVRQNNPLFVPEHRFDNTVGAKALFAIGHYEAIGFSPFGIESNVNMELANAYRLIEQLHPIIVDNFGQNKIDGVLLEKDKILSTVVLGDYEFSFKNSYTLGWEAGATDEVWDSGGAIIIQTDTNEFFVAGSGIVVTFKNWKQRDKIVGILKNEEGKFKDGKWEVIRHLNGDQTHQGRHIRISHGDYSIQRIQLYEYE